jgi:hypothetical protein
MSPIRQPYTVGRTYRTTERAPWSPAQFVAVAAGLVLVVIGGIALARSGAHFNALPLTHTMVAGLHFSALSAVVQLAAGVILLGGGAYPYSAKGTMATMGVILLAWGLIVAIDPQPFFNMWGYTTSAGVFYAVMGGILIVAAAVSPIFFSRRVGASEAGVYEPGPYDEPAARVVGGSRRI